MILLRIIHSVSNPIDNLDWGDRPLKEDWEKVVRALKSKDVRLNDLMKTAENQGWNYNMYVAKRLEELPQYLQDREGAGPNEEMGLCTVLAFGRACMNVVLQDKMEEFLTW